MNSLQKLLPALCVICASNAYAAPFELVSNGGFESGLTAWVASSTGTSRGFCDVPWNVGTSGEAAGCWSRPYEEFVSPLEGQRAAYNSFDGNGPLTYRLSQTVAFSISGVVTHASLSWWDAVGLGFGVFRQPRVFGVDLELQGQTFSVFSESFSNNPPGLFQTWEQTLVNLTSVLGRLGAGDHTLTLSFSNFIPQPFTGPASFGLDSVSLLIETRPAADVPEPGSIAVFALAVAAVGVGSRRTRVLSEQAGSLGKFPVRPDQPLHNT